MKVAGATTKHCIILHGKSTFLSGTSGSSDTDPECYTRANVANSRATDLTISLCPLNMHGTAGITQVISALLHGACTLDTDDQQNVQVWYEGTFSTWPCLVSAATATFLTAMEPQQLWTGSLPVCLVEYHQGRSRRRRLVLASQALLTEGEQSLLNVHNSGLIFAYAADRRTEPEWFVVPDGQQPMPGVSFMLPTRAGIAFVLELVHATRKGEHKMLQTRPKTSSLNHSTKSIIMTPGGAPSS